MAKRSINSVGVTLRYTMSSDDLDGMMDVEEFGQSILGLGKSFYAVRKSLSESNNINYMSRLNIKGDIKKGSIIVSLVEICPLIALSVLDAMLLNECSYLYFMRFLKNTEYYVEELLKNGRVKVVTKDNRVSEVKHDIYRLSKVGSVSSNFKKFLIPLHDNVVNKIDICYMNEHKSITQTLRAEDYSLFPDIMDIDIENIITEIRPIITNVNGQNKGWYFSFKGKEQRMYIEDNDFLRLIEENKIILTNRDRLKVDIEVISNKRDKISHKYIIKHVQSYNNKPVSYFYNTL